MLTLGRNSKKIRKSVLFKMMMDKRESNWAEAARIIGVKRTTLRYQIENNIVSAENRIILITRYRMNEIEQRQIFGGK
jgi:transcriptional regulator with GAF, ATPase, and Fis domain